jgi:corrinoid protein of di/trimethylamine methyltransferase
MDNNDILKDLANAVIEGDNELAMSSAKAVLENNMDPLQAVEEGLSKGMDVIGRQFESGEVFLPELLMAANAFKAAMDILKPELEAQKKSTTKMGTVLLGTVKGDLHNIGKNIVATVLDTNGFEVIDIGIDNSPLTFIEQAEKAQVDIIGLSCLMTTTMPAQREVIQTLSEMNKRDKYKVIVGGGPVTQEWADQIGADGYSESAVQAVNLVKGLLDIG